MFLEAHLRCLYRLLGHEGMHTRVGALDVVSGDYEDLYVKGESEVIEYARKWNGQRNVFIGRAGRDASGTPVRSNVISFDIDPIRDKGLPSTESQHKDALQAGHIILRMFQGGYMASSGNGCLLLFPYSDVSNVVPEYFRRESALISELRDAVKHLNVRIDSTSYANAVIKAIGTISTKGPEEQRRCSQFYDLPIAPFTPATKLVEKLKSYELFSPETNKDKFQGDPIERMHAAQDALNKLSPARVDSYEDWLKVGMALKEFGISGLSLWKDWSSKSSKYDATVCEAKWRTFSDTPSVTLGSLKFWSKTDDEKVTYFDRLFAPMTGEAFELGFKQLDEALDGYPIGELITFAARTGFGKTTLACTVANHLRKKGKKVLYFSTELPNDALMHKLTSAACGIPLANLVKKNLSAQEISVVKAWMPNYQKFPIKICDEFQPTLERVEQEVKVYGPDVFFFDHINQIASDWQELFRYLNGLKKIALKYQTRLVALAQMNEPPRNPRTGEDFPSRRQDVAGGQHIIRLSGRFTFMTNPYKVEGRFQPVEFHIEKGRYGPWGQVITLYCDKEVSRFQEGKP